MTTSGESRDIGSSQLLSPDPVGASGPIDGAPAIEVRDLSISVGLGDGARAIAVSGVNFEVRAGGTLGIVGESGSGKTLTCLAIMGLLPPGARVETGEILFEGEDLVKKSKRAMRRLRGRRLSMVLQDPMTALDPMYTVGNQLAQPLRRHHGLRGSKLHEAMIKSLDQVHLVAPRDRLSQYPHQLSGGMRQRVVSAIALSGKPSLLIADEPTTALDATTQAKYLQLLRELQQETGVTLIMVAHDLHVVRRVCERVCVMYASEIVEEGEVEDVFSTPQHPYTRALLGAIPVIKEGMELESIEGQAPELHRTIVGCRFAERCKYVRDVCVSDHPPLTSRRTGGTARCFGTESDGWVQS